MATLETLLSGVFRAWRRAGIGFVVLRNYENLPASTSNDIDVLVRPEELGRAEQVLVSAAHTAGYRLHNRVEYASLALYFYHPESLRQIQFDLYPEVDWRGFTVVEANTVVAEQVDGGLFAIPQPAHEAVISLLGRLLQHGVVADKYKSAILAGFNSSAEKAKQVLARPFGAALAEAVAARALAQDWSGVEALAKRLRRALVWRALTRRPLATAAALARDGLRLTRRWRRPGGLMLVMLGADGSGKSTVAALATEQLRPTFPPGKGLQIHWKPVVFFPKRRRPTGRPNLDPHGRPPRGRLASLGYLGGHWLEFLLGSWFQFRPALFRGGLVLVDRYYYDFLVDQRRYRLCVPKALVRALFRCLRQPDLVFLLNAPAEVIQARKQEVPPPETARQVEAYCRLAADLPQGRVLDATAPAERVAADLTRQVLEWLVTRARRT